MNEALKICAIGLICTISCVIIKNCQSSFIIPTRIAGVVFLYGLVIALISPMMEYLHKIMEMSLPIDDIKIILKAMSIAYITQITSEICNDCGEASLARCVDTIGKMEILILGVPLVERIIKLSEELIV